MAKAPRKKVSSTTRKKKVAPVKPPKVAHTLFDYTEGPAEAPSDPKVVAEIIKEAMAVCAKMKPLDHESRLSVAKRVVKGMNATTRLFNCAVFVVPSGDEAPPELPLAEKPANLPDLF